jgi:hypothetical protein
MTSENPGIPLAKTIQDLRRELLTAVEEGSGQPLRFKLKPIELELNVAMTYKAEVNAGVKFWVVDLGGKALGEQTTSHKLKLVLQPVDPTGSEYVVRDKDD